MADKWIAGATENAHGQFRAKAKKAGMSTRAYAAKESKPGSGASKATKKQAVLAKTLMNMNHPMG